MKVFAADTPYYGITVHILFIIVSIFDGFIGILKIMIATNIIIILILCIHNNMNILFDLLSVESGTLCGTLIIWMIIHNYNKIWNVPMHSNVGMQSNCIFVNKIDYLDGILSIPNARNMIILILSSIVNPMRILFNLMDVSNGIIDGTSR